MIDPVTGTPYLSDNVNIQLPASGTYTTEINAFFPTYTTTQKQLLWQSFLNKYGYAANPSNTDSIALSRFSTFIHSQATPLEDKGPYQDLLSAFLPGDNADQKAQVWYQFIDSQNKTSNPPDNSQSDIASLVTYLRQLTPNTAFPTTGPFGDLIRAFVGTIPAQDVAKMQVYWNNFLSMNGYTQNPSSTDAQGLLKFAQFAQAIVDVQHASTIYSPLELQKRQVLEQTLNALLEIIGSMQNTIAVRSRSLLFWGAYQQEYTSMLTKVPTYTTSGPTSWTIDTTNADNWIVGYDGISMGDISNYIGKSIHDGDTSASFTLGNDYTTDSNSTVTITFHSGSLTDSTNLPGFTIKTSLNSTPINVTIPQSAFSGALTVSDYSNVVKEQFLQMYNDSTTTYAGYPTVTASGDATVQQIISKIVTDSGHTPLIQTPYTSNDQTTATVRGEINTREQQVASNIRGFRTAVQQRSQLIQSFLSTDKDALQKTEDLLTSLLETTMNLSDQLTR